MESVQGVEDGVKRRLAIRLSTCMTVKTLSSFLYLY